MKKINWKKGFTLVEILIVVIILGILAAIIIPQFTNASDDARKSSLDSNLQTLRSQFELYKVQHVPSIYPWDDDSGGLDTSDNIIARLINRTDDDGTVNTTTGKWGPYMQNVPLNPLCDHAADDTPVFGTAAASDGSVDWVIDVNSGAITDGTDVSTTP